jgi:uncharacterized protein YceH (UPF0502 family)
LPVLNLNERRVLGVLVEKAKTTPDAYPMSLNSLVTGSNQKSNRDPVLDLSDLDVEEALTSAQKKGLVIKITTTSGRVERWKHNLYEAWKADKVELAILAELLLRGPQTEGELRGRASRMEPIEDLDSLRALLKPLKERGLVVYLSSEGRRGTMVTHGFHAPEDLRRLRERHSAEETGSAAAPSSAPNRPPDSSPTQVPAGRPTGGEALAALEASVQEGRAEIADLRQLVTRLDMAVTDLKAQVQSLKEALGVG